MTILIILSLILYVFVAFGIGQLIDINTFSAKQKLFGRFVFVAYMIFVLSFMISISSIIERTTEKALLDRPNSYKKEYTYKQIDSEFVAIDSTYIKK